MHVVAERRYEGRHRLVGEETVKLNLPRTVGERTVEYRSKSLADEHAKTKVIRTAQYLRAHVRALLGVGVL